MPVGGIRSGAPKGFNRGGEWSSPGGRSWLFMCPYLPAERDSVRVIYQFSSVK